MQTGLLLILGTLVSLIGWMFIYPVDGGPDATSAEKAADLMADPGLGKLGMLMGFGGMFAIFIGFLTLPEKWQLEMVQDLPMQTLPQSSH